MLTLANRKKSWRSTSMSPQKENMHLWSASGWEGVNSALQPEKTHANRHNVCAAPHNQINRWTTGSTGPNGCDPDNTTQSHHDIKVNDFNNWDLKQAPSVHHVIILFIYLFLKSTHLLDPLKTFNYDVTVDGTNPIMTSRRSRGNKRQNQSTVSKS